MYGRKQRKAFRDWKKIMEGVEGLTENSTGIRMSLQQVRNVVQAPSENRAVEVLVQPTEIPSQSCLTHAAVLTVDIYVLKNCCSSSLV